MADPIRLVGIDLDGTLLRPDHSVSARTRRALEAFQDAGHRVVVITGRSRFSALPRLEGVPIERVVCTNGAYEHDRSAGRLVWSETVGADEARGWEAELRERFAHASFGWEGLESLVFDDAFHAAAGGDDEVERGSVRGRAPDGPLHKLYVRTAELAGADLQRAVAEILGARAEAATSGVPFVELTAPGVTKARALERVARAAGVSRERTVAIGDNLNDVPMLEWAGTGIAMGNAVAGARRAADEVTASNLEDGVALALERLLGRPFARHRPGTGTA